jgi:hypothetical protein
MTMAFTTMTIHRRTRHRRMLAHRLSVVSEASKTIIGRQYHPEGSRMMQRTCSARLHGGSPR